jgi:protein-tyrosine phosphatase
MTGTLFNELPAPTRAALSGQNHLRLGCSNQPLMREISRELPWPLLTSSSSPERPEERYESAGDLQQRSGGVVELIADSGPPRYQDRSTVVHIGSSGWEVTEEGIVGRRTVAQLASEIVLFVCTGNTCRSPMAESLFRKTLAEHLDCPEEALIDRGYVVLSAGLATTAGMPASEHSVSVVGEEGIDLTGHQSQPATAELLGVADHIVTMTRSHRESILARFPDLAPRVRLMSPEGRDVLDPFGGDRCDYERCRDEIRDHLPSLMASLWPATFN